MSITRARESMSLEEYRIKELSDKIIESPHNPILLNNRGLAYCYIKKYEEGEADFDAALKTVGPDTQNVIPHVIFNRAAWSYLKQQKYELTIEECTRGLEIKEDQKALHHKFYNTRAVAYDRLGQTQKALRDYTSAINIKPTGQYYSNRGTVYRNLAQYDASKSDFDNALAEHPTQPDILRNRALLFIDLGQYEDALNDLNLAIQTRSKYFDAYCSRANVFIEIGKLDEAAKDLSICLQLDQKHLIANALQALYYACRRENEKAIEHFSATCAYWDKCHDDKKYYEGCIFLELKNYEGSLRSFDESWRLKQKDYHSFGHKILARRAFSYAQLKNWSAAEKDIKLALFYSPSHPKYKQWLQLIEEGLKQSSNTNTTVDESNK
eukprot:TRINITY_DN9417_c0_g1_i2.p1 TRINITY_DN9417_c0_g1~~TRINITY_DN9417_c0_g1_i2.p1  ORF type:complete len:381 (+),score=52.42 TRINITY_DN9417_c0_g1_i2:184-1326(+)